MKQKTWSVTDIPFGLAILVGFEMMGEVVSHLTPVKAPGAVIGMVLLTAVLVLRDAKAKAKSQDQDTREPTALDRVADAMIGNMGLMFIPAGVGIVAQLGLVSANVVALTTAVIVSTVAGLVATGAVFVRVMGSQGGGEGDDQ